jgi:hypothetical protein
LSIGLSRSLIEDATGLSGGVLTLAATSRSEKENQDATGLPGGVLTRSYIKGRKDSLATVDWIFHSDLLYSSVPFHTTLGPYYETNSRYFDWNVAVRFPASTAM